MTKGEITRVYQRFSAEERATLDRWIKANAIVGSIFAGALIAMAVIGSNTTGPRQAVAEDQLTEVSAAARHNDQAQVSPYELTIRLAPDQIPVQQVDEPF